MSTKRFEISLTTALGDIYINEFDKLVSKFIVFLFEANSQLAGPKNLAITLYRKFYERKIT